MIMDLLSIKKMAIKLNKKNPVAKDLFTKKYKSKVVKPKKGKGSFKRKKS
jgi:stalled ribosome alternative rescue factor ArfA